MEERCEFCELFRKLYVPPVKDFDDILKDAYVCTLIDGEAMYLGQGDNAKNGMCECFKFTTKLATRQVTSKLENAGMTRVSEVNLQQSAN